MDFVRDESVLFGVGGLVVGGLLLDLAVLLGIEYLVS